LWSNAVGVRMSMEPAHGVDARQARQGFCDVVGRQISHVVCADHVRDEVGVALCVQRSQHAGGVTDHDDVLHLDGFRRVSRRNHRLANHGQNPPNFTNFDAGASNQATKRFAWRHGARYRLGLAATRQCRVEHDRKACLARQRLQSPSQILGGNGQGGARLGGVRDLPGVGRRRYGREDGDGRRREEAGLLNRHVDGSPATELGR